MELQKILSEKDHGYNRMAKVLATIAVGLTREGDTFRFHTQSGVGEEEVRAVVSILWTFASLNGGRGMSGFWGAGQECHLRISFPSDPPRIRRGTFNYSV